MRLPLFTPANIEAILAEWDLLPPHCCLPRTECLTLELRDHAKQILEAIGTGT